MSKPQSSNGISSSIFNPTNTSVGNADDKINSSNNIVLPPAFLEDSSAFLTSIASQPPSHKGISLLAGPVSKWFVSGVSASTEQQHPAKHIAGIYLNAAASQLRENPNQNNVQAVTANNTASSTLGSMASAILGSRVTTGTSNSNEQDKTRTKCRLETLAAVNAAAILCSCNREAITNSGILPVLAQISTKSMMPSSSTKNDASLATSLSSLPASSSKSFPTLNTVQNVFLQCAVAAGQYAYAEGIIRGTWPCPSSALKDVSIVLRYYFLRGIIHFGCQDYTLAHRCWWTVLSIPSDDGCSPIAVNAWKKLILVQPLLLVSNDSSSTASSSIPPATRLPKCVPKLPNRGSDSSKFYIDFTESKEEETDDISIYKKLGPAVKAGDRQTVETLVRNHESVLVADGNLGMAQDCIRRVREVQVLIASKRFSVSSIAILSRQWKISFEEVSQQLLDANKIVPCQLEEDGTVVFPDADSTYANNQQSLGDLTQWMKLLERMQQLDMDISTNSKYSSSIRRDDKSAGSSSGAMMSEMFTAGVEDF